MNKLILSLVVSIPLFFTIPWANANTVPNPLGTRSSEVSQNNPIRFNPGTATAFFYYGWRRPYYMGFRPVYYRSYYRTYPYYRYYPRYRYYRPWRYW